MSANEWSNEAKRLVRAALDAAQSNNNAAILALQDQFLAHKRQKVPEVASQVSDAFSAAMFALIDAIVSNVVADWAALKGELETSAAAIEGTANDAAKAAKWISLQPVKEIATELTAIVNDVKNLKDNPKDADAVAQSLQDIQQKLQSILSEAGGVG